MLIVAAMAAHCSVKIVLGCLPDIASTNVFKSQLNDAVVSLYNNAAPKIIVCFC
jgi:hypothetical protein